MKTPISRYCYLGIDDGYFDIYTAKRKNRKVYTVLVGVLWVKNKLLNIYIEYVEVDGLDATLKAFKIIDRVLGGIQRLNAVFLDGVTYAGFNIVDPYRLWILTDTPIIVIFRHRLDLDRVEKALRNHFVDADFRYRIIRSVYSRARELTSNKGTLLYTAIGLNTEKAEKMILENQTVFPEPIPLKLADLIASALGRKYMVVR